MGIYGFGKAFNTRYVNSGQFCKMPHVNVRPQQRPVFFGGHSCSSNTNITINNGPQGFWGFLSGLFSTGFLGNILSMFGFGGGMNMGMGMGMGMPTMGTSPYGMLNQAQMQPNTQNQPKLGDRLNDLKTLYPNWNIVSDGQGHYDATSKDGTVHHEGDFDQMCELLKTTKAPESNGAPEDTNPEPKPKDDIDKGKGNDGAARPAGNNNAAARKGDGEDNRVAKHKQDIKTTGTEKNDIDKTKPITANITFSIHSMGQKDGTATVTIDGKTYTAKISGAESHSIAMDTLANDIRKQLKADGWTNVTLVNNNFKFKQGEPKPEVDGITGAAPKAKTNWTAEEKAKPQTLKIRFAIHTNTGNFGTASVTTPDGDTHTVSTGPSLTSQRAREFLSKDMKALLSQKGWTNVTLENTNFNWSD